VARQALREAFNCVKLNIEKIEKSDHLHAQKREYPQGFASGSACTEKAMLLPVFFLFTNDVVDSLSFFDDSEDQGIHWIRIQAYDAGSGSTFLVTNYGKLSSRCKSMYEEILPKL
jgi:hypothetical protein